MTQEFYQRWWYPWVQVGLTAGILLLAYVGILALLSGPAAWF